MFVHDCARTVEREVSRRFLGVPSNVLPASLRKELLSGAKRAQTARGHNAIPKGLCRYSLHNAIPKGLCRYRFTGDGQVERHYTRGPELGLGLGAASLPRVEVTIFEPHSLL